MQDITTDFLVIGSGVAGLRAAIELASKGSVLVVTKDIPTESSTEYAQGGVAVALSDEDEVGIHFEDTIRAGDGLCREDAVRVLVEEGPDRIRELIEWGAEFDREGTKLAFTLEAAHSRRRVLHANGDSTGKELERALLSKVMSIAAISRLPFSIAADLIVEDNICAGAYILKNSKMCRVFAKATILATGGAGQAFSRTTNPAVATGDGMAIAYRAGAALEDMEFVQFHPTALYAPSAPQFLLTEAMRGEGAVLKNSSKEPFMSAYHEKAELAPRDIVSRAIISEMVRTKSNNVYLDLTHKESGFIKRRFPRIYSTCLRYDVDITRDMIPVSPAAHYIMGGVKTDLDGATNIKGLYAAGEVACTGVHGANRLASNSLLEGLVYGFRAGRAAASGTNGGTADTKNFRDNVLFEDAKDGATDIDELRSIIRRVMWDRVGIIRCGVSLSEAWDKLSEMKSLLGSTFMTRRGLELRNMLTVSLLITKAAGWRKGSIGGHYRSDFTDRGNEWKQRITLSKKDGL
ncbi:MAG: L-aspartate oxidase [Nitrospirae bacterium]|nr:MAG: L-aspartate oxidase [Nitrospirota bacterium]